MMNKSIKNIRKQFREQGVYYTPEKLALTLKGYVGREVENVYDPTCGQGNLLKVFPDNIPKYGQEIDCEELEKAKQIPGFTGVCGDTLKAPAFLGTKFDCIMANPPFSLKWEPIVDDRFKDAPVVPTGHRADYAFILHILHFLSDDGIAVVLNSPGILFRGGREGKIRKWIIEQNLIDRVVLIPGNTFEDTSIPTALLVLRKNRLEDYITFTDYAEDKSLKVGIHEVATNDYILSVSSYVTPPEPPKQTKEEEKKTLLEIQEKARNEAIKMITSDLAVDKMVCELEDDLASYLQYKERVIHAIQEL